MMDMSFDEWYDIFLDRVRVLGYTDAPDKDTFEWNWEDGETPEKAAEDFVKEMTREPTDKELKALILKVSTEPGKYHPGVPVFEEGRVDVSQDVLDNIEKQEFRIQIETLYNLLYTLPFVQKFRPSALPQLKKDLQRTLNAITAGVQQLMGVDPKMMWPEGIRERAAREEEE